MKKITLLTILSLSLFAEEFPKTNIRYVLVQSGALNIREKPVNGKVIAKLKAGEKITVIGDTPESENIWKKIKTSKNVIGFASSEFLGYYRPEEIQKGKLIGVLRPEGQSDKSTSASLKILGMSLAGKWYGDDGSGDFLYLLNFLVQNKKPLDIFENGKKFGKFNSEGITGTGCQEHKGLKGIVSNITIEEKFYIGALGLSASKIDYSVSDKISDSISSNLIKEAVSIFKKNKVPLKFLENLSEKKMTLFKAGNGKSYIVGRYAVNKEHAELYSFSFVAEVLPNNEYKLIHNNFEALSEERGNYGGSYHFMGLINIDDSGIPAILFFHIGFDSGIYELFQIKNNKIESLFLGGGDAC